MKNSRFCSSYNEINERSLIIFTKYNVYTVHCEVNFIIMQ